MLKAWKCLMAAQQFLYYSMLGDLGPERQTLERTMCRTQTVNIIENKDVIPTDHVVRWRVRLGKDKHRISEQAIVINRLKNRSNRLSPRKLDLIVSSGSELQDKAA